MQKNEVKISLECLFGEFIGREAVIVALVERVVAKPAIQVIQFGSLQTKYDRRLIQLSI